jgi:hypothetical protein
MVGLPGLLAGAPLPLPGHPTVNGRGRPKGGGGLCYLGARNGPTDRQGYGLGGLVVP